MRQRFSHDQSVFVYALLAGAPAVGIVLYSLWSSGSYAPRVQWTLSLLVLGFWIGFAAAARMRVVRPLQTMANLLGALREGDFAIRARGAKHDDPLGEVLVEINQLGSVLQEQRLGALEATTLLRTVMEEIDVAVFAFDASSTLRLVNRSGQELLKQPAERILGRSASEIGLADCLDGEEVRVLPITAFPGATGRWGMRRTSFREGGRPHILVVIADLSQALRAEELKAWQRLVRVLGHELNNSLAPIKSIAGSLGAMVRKNPRPDDWEDDMKGGLDVIASRADSLTRFMQAYANLAKLPAPTLSPCDFRSLVLRVCALGQRTQVHVVEGPAITLPCDAAQIEQVLINLVKNAVEAVQEGGGVQLRWARRDNLLDVFIEDEGPGVASATNLFVPFFTTKPSGSGIGLVLSRQIAENHGGSIKLENRTDRTGCVATLTLPLERR
ncbi:PAS domain-containing sensor histidine kinase [Opitutaceae bacterium EW11]|nr:PAS domain-containing sensor histidine kinase [Opitutaceae bacterium EW11]